MLDLDSCRAKQQRADEHLKANRYRDFNLVFCKELDCYEPGLPLLLNNIGQREYRKLVKAAKVKDDPLPRAETHRRDAPAPKRRTSRERLKMLGHSRVSMTTTTTAATCSRAASRQRQRAWRPCSTGSRDPAPDPARQKHAVKRGDTSGHDEAHWKRQSNRNGRINGT